MLRREGRGIEVLERRFSGDGTRLEAGPGSVGCHGSVDFQSQSEGAASGRGGDAGWGAGGHGTQEVPEFEAERFSARQIELREAEACGGMC